MPLSCFRRPLTLAALSLILLLCLLKRLGCFQVDPAPDLLAYAYLDGVCYQGRVVSGFSAKRQGERVWLRLVSAAGSCSAADSGWSKLKKPVLVMAYLPAGEPGSRLALPGSLLRVEGRLRLGRSAKNPGEFDEKAFLEDRGSAFVLHGKRSLRAESPGPWRLPWTLAASAHRSIHDYLTGNFPRDTAAVLEGVMLGYKGALSTAANRSVQDAGAMHILVPSGAKVAFVLGFCAWILGRLGCAPSGRWAGGALVGAFYVLAAGGDAPYTRAYFCAMAMAAAWALDRESGAFQGLALSALITLLVEPRELFTTGFQMTYSAVLGLCLVMPRLRLPAAWHPALRRGLQLATVSAVVQVMLWPIFAGVFARASLIGVLSNLLLVPYSGLVMGAGFLSWGISFLDLPPLLQAVEICARALADAFLIACRFFAEIPGAAVDLAPMGTIEVAAYYAAVFGLLVLPRWRVTAFAWLLAAALGTAGAASSALERSRARVLFLSSPKGMAALAFLPGEQPLLVGGPVRPSLLRQVLRRLGEGPVGSARMPREGRPFLLGFGRLRVLFSRETARVLGPLPGGEAEYCILGPPSRFSAGDCPGGRVFSPSRQGAVWILSDGDYVEIRAQDESDPLGGAVL